MRFLFLAFFTILCFSCSSKPKNAADQNSEAAGEVFELYGNSDSKSAGGLRTVHFQKDSSSLSESSKNDLRNNAAWLKARPKVSVEIEGHCDERGSAEYNLALGERRAKAAQKYLTTLNLKAENLSVISYGKEKPAVMGNDEAAWAKNRRDEFVVAK